jgi:hypothetical protein
VLQSIVDWVEDASLQLLGGNRLLLRLPPRHGKTFLTSLVKETLGETSIRVDGINFPEGDQKLIREALRKKIIETVERHGSAQLIFDNYNVAVNRNQGKLLDVMLNGVLIDHEVSREVGALFTARCSVRLDHRGAGSPLMSRVQPLSPPHISRLLPGDLDESGLQEWFGDSALLVEQCLSVNAGVAVTLADRFEMDRSYIGDVLAVAKTELESKQIDDMTMTYAARCAVSGLITMDGPTGLYSRLQKIFFELDEGSAAWPANVEASAKKFASLLGGASEVIWFDRYMFRDIEYLRNFAIRVADQTSCRLLLVGSRTVSEREVSRAEMWRLSSLSNVDARWLAPSDYSLLHDRHLVTGDGGWVMPQVHVVVGRQAPGSAVVAPVSSFAMDYRSVWHRASEANPA